MEERQNSGITQRSLDVRVSRADTVIARYPVDTTDSTTNASDNELYYNRSYYIVKQSNASVPEKFTALEAAWRALGRSECCQRGTIL